MPDITIAEKPAPTPVTFVLHSTSGYQNNYFFARTMDENLARWNIVRVIVEDGSGVTAMAMRWCKRNRVRLTVVIVDLKIAQRDDRKRRYQYMADERPDVVLIFSLPPRWQQFVETLHGAGCPISLVYSDAQQPRYLRWAPGMTRMPHTIRDSAIATAVRRGRPKKIMTPEQRAERIKDNKALWRERQRIRKALQNPFAKPGRPGRKKRGPAFTGQG
jgi:hypothetical protein